MPSTRASSWRGTTTARGRSYRSSGPSTSSASQRRRPVSDGLGEQVANNIRMTSEGETTVLKFKAGDRVRMSVTVMETDPHDREFPYRVEGPGGTCWWAKAGDVEEIGRASCRERV